MSNVDNHVGGVGAKLRRRRQSLGLTINQLAARAGLSSGYVSMLERDHGNPSMAALKALGDVLDVPMVELVAEGNWATRGDIVTRPGARVRFSYPESDALQELLSAGIGGAIQFTLMHLPPGGASATGRHHRGEECGYVVIGHLSLELADRTFELDQGSAVCFDSSMPHRWINSTDSEAQVVLAGNPPSIF